MSEEQGNDGPQDQQRGAGPAGSQQPDWRPPGPPPPGWAPPAPPPNWGPPAPPAPQGWGPPAPPAPQGWAPPPQSERESVRRRWSPLRRNLVTAATVFVVVSGVGSAVILSQPAGGRAQAGADKPGPAATLPSSPVLGSDAPSAIGTARQKDSAAFGRRVAALINSRSAGSLVDVGCADDEGVGTLGLSIGDVTDADALPKALTAVSHAAYVSSKWDASGGLGDITLRAQQSYYGFLADATIVLNALRDTSNSVCVEHVATSLRYTGAVSWPAPGAPPAGRAGICSGGEGSSYALSNVTDVVTVHQDDPNVALDTEDLRDIANCAPGLQPQVYRLLGEKFDGSAMVEPLNGGRDDAPTVSYGTTAEDGKKLTFTLTDKGDYYVVTKIAIG